MKQFTTIFLTATLLLLLITLSAAQAPCSGGKVLSKCRKKRDTTKRPRGPGGPRGPRGKPCCRSQVAPSISDCEREGTTPSGRTWCRCTKPGRPIKTDDGKKCASCPEKYFLIGKPPMCVGGEGTPHECPEGTKPKKGKGGEEDSCVAKPE